MGTSPLQRLLSRAAVLLLVPAIACLSPAEESDRKGRDSYLEAYVASHGSVPPPDASYASPSQPVPTYAAPAPAYGPPHRAYPHPPHHHLHHHAYGPPVVIAGGGGGDYGPDNGNGGEMTGNGGGGGVDIATFLHALGKILVVKVIIKLVAVIIALLFLPKIKEKKKKKKPIHKPHRPQHDEDDSDKDEYEDDDDDDRRRRRALGGKVRGFGTSSGDPRLLDLAQWVLQSIETYATDNGNSASEMSSTDRPADS